MKSVKNKNVSGHSRWMAGSRLANDPAIQQECPYIEDSTSGNGTHYQVSLSATLTFRSE